MVRYRHADGSTVWVRCRGLAIRDESGRPIRMLGAHDDQHGIETADRAAGVVDDVLGYTRVVGEESSTSSPSSSRRSSTASCPTSAGRSRRAARWFERSGLVDDVVQFEDAGEAIGYLVDGNRPDVILPDIRMPGMNGFELLDLAMETVGEWFARAVVLMLTTSLDPADRERAAGYEAVRDHLYEPLTADHVPRLVELVERFGTGDD